MKARVGLIEFQANSEVDIALEQLIDRVEANQRDVAPAQQRRRVQDCSRSPCVRGGFNFPPPVWAVRRENEVPPVGNLSTQSYITNIANSPRNYDVWVNTIKTFAQGPHLLSGDHSLCGTIEHCQYFQGSKVAVSFSTMLCYIQVAISCQK